MIGGCCRLMRILLVTVLLVPGVAAYGALECYDCHGTRVPPDFRPLDAGSRTPSTGGFPGNHRTHVSRTDSSAACEKCHPGSSSYTTDHRDGLIKLSSALNASAGGVYGGMTSAFPQTTTPVFRTCTNINCHFDAQTPIWGAPNFTFPADCGRCHGAPPSGGGTGAAGSHAKHDFAYPGAAYCSLCHGGHTTFAHATSAGRRPLAVAPRHSGDAEPGSYSGPVDDYFPRQDNTFGRCSNFYCHSNGASVSSGVMMPFSTAVWGTSMSCSGCHEYPPAYQNGSVKKNSHSRHGDYGFTCVRCHSATTADNTSIADPSRHVNRQFDIAGTAGETITYAFSSTGGTCSNAYCHSNGTSVSSGVIPANTSPKWGAGPMSCTGCHSYPPSYGNGAPKANSHPKHAVYDYACSTCHSSTTADGATIASLAAHANGSYEVSPGNGVTMTYAYNKSGGTCTNSCHNDGTSVSTGVLRSSSAQWGKPAGCAGCHNLRPAYVNGEPKANSHIGRHSIYTCSTCHYATTTNGVTVSSPARHLNGVYDVSPKTAGFFSYAYAPTGGVCSNVVCHANPDGYRPWGAKACDACHDAPPDTASHRKHFGGSVADAAYGDTRITRSYSSNSQRYVFNCGNCHPIDSSMHGNGSVDVELYNPQAPAGSLKSRNPATAAYATGSTYAYDSRGFLYSVGGSCSTVYCHSYNDWTTPVDCVFSNDSGSRYCDSYAEANLVTTRKYRTPEWGGTLPGNCSGCHGNAPTTTSATNDGGTGNSHSWIDNDGWEEGHFNKWAFPMDPITCNYCHNDTVKAASRWFRESPWGFTNFSGVPIANFSRHVDGTVDVAFEKSQPFVFSYSDWYGNRKQVFKKLSSASFNPATQTCSNVSCHRAQTTVKWGTPYRAFMSDWGYDYRCWECHNGN